MIYINSLPHIWVEDLVIDAPPPALLLELLLVQPPAAAPGAGGLGGVGGRAASMGWISV
jgi:hypothetical protein